MQIFLAFSVLSASNWFVVQSHHRHTKSAAHATYCARAPADPRFGSCATSRRNETQEKRERIRKRQKSQIGNVKRDGTFFFFFFYKWAKNIYIYIYLCVRE